MWGVGFRLVEVFLFELWVFFCWVYSVVLYVWCFRGWKVGGKEENYYSTRLGYS